MNYRETVDMRHRSLPHLEASIRIRASPPSPDNLAFYGHVAILTIGTGFCSVQLYASAAKLRELAHVLLAAATELQRQAIDADVCEVA